MSIRNSHAGKSQSMKDNYSRYISQVDYQPTIDEKINLNSSNKTGEELSVSTSERKRKINTSARFSDHLSEHWPSYLITFIICLMGYFMFDSKINISKIEKDLEFQDKKDIELEYDVIKQRDKNIDQDLRINENSIHIKYLKETKDNNKNNITPNKTDVNSTTKNTK